MSAYRLCGPSWRCAGKARCSNVGHVRGRYSNSRKPSSLCTRKFQSPRDATARGWACLWQGSVPHWCTGSSAYAFDYACASSWWQRHYYGVEDLVAKFCEDTHIAGPYVALYIGLVLGMHGMRWYHNSTIVIAHVLKHSIERRLVFVRLDDGSFQVVWHEHLRHAAQMLETLCNGIYK